MKESQTPATVHERYAAMRRALIVVLAAHAAMALAKGGYGAWSGSLGMAADGLHSLLHALGALVGIAGVSLAARPPDPSHPYGYERYEPLAALGIVALMLLAVREILFAGWERATGGGGEPRVEPASFLVMGVSALGMLAVAAYERQRGEALGSEVLATDGRRALADVLVSLSVVAGLAATLAGVRWADLLVSLVVVAVIGWTGWTALREVSAILTDAAVADLDRIGRAAAAVEGIRGVHGVRARGAAGAVRVDLHATVDPALPTAEAHELSHRVVEHVRAEVGGIAEVLVHVGVDPEEDHRDGEHWGGLGHRGGQQAVRDEMAQTGDQFSAGEWNVIETGGLTRRFGDVTAADQVTLSVRAGEVFGLLGPNGAGKSTVIKMLTTLLPPSGGWARVSGFDVVRQAGQVRRVIGYVPQLLSADGTLTGYENLWVFARLYDLPRGEREPRIRAALELMDLQEAADKLVGEYSGGMIRRLEIAQAILHRPRVLFLDEPTLGLDPIARQVVWQHLQQLRVEFGTTVFLTTHYMDEADALCDRVAIMHRGTVAVVGRPADLKAALGGGEVTLDDVFTHYAGDTLEPGGTYRETARARSAARRLG